MRGLWMVCAAVLVLSIGARAFGAEVSDEFIHGYAAAVLEAKFHLKGRPWR